MNEAETRAEHIDPALKAAGWGVVEGSRIRREYLITPGRIEGHGRRGKPLIADYVLKYRNTKLAVVEAKAWDEALTEGVAQAKNYAGQDGDPLHLFHQRPGHLRHRHADRQGRRDAALSHAGRTLEHDLRRSATHGATASPPCPSRTRAAPIPSRYYQDIAVERVMEAIAADAAAHPAHAGHRHRQDLHRLSDRLEAVPQPLEPEPRAVAPPAHPVPRRPQHPRRPGLQRLLRVSRGCAWSASSRRTSARRARSRRTPACSSPSSRPS